MTLETFPKEYYTTDTKLAAYLISAGFDLLIIQYSDVGNSHLQGTFVFEKSDKLIEHVRLFNTDQATVNPATYDRIKGNLLDKVRRQLP